MSAASPIVPREPSPQEIERKRRLVMAVVFFIVGFSVILSYNWSAATPQFRPDAVQVILFGILVSAIIYIASRYATGGPGSFGLRFCPNCGRQIRFDATVCRFCGHRLP